MKTDPDTEELEEESELDPEIRGPFELLEAALTYCLCFVPSLLFSLLIGACFGIKTASFWWGTLAFVFSFTVWFVPSQKFAERKIKN